MTSGTVVHELAGGDIVLWVDNGVICIKTVEKHNDPVELNEDEAEELAALLTRLVSQCRAGN